MPCRFDVMETKVDSTFEGALQQLLSCNASQRHSLQLPLSQQLSS